MASAFSICTTYNQSRVGRVLLIKYKPYDTGPHRLNSAAHSLLRGEFHSDHAAPVERAARMGAAVGDEQHAADLADLKGLTVHMLVHVSFGDPHSWDAAFLMSKPTSLRILALSTTTDLAAEGDVKGRMLVRVEQESCAARRHLCLHRSTCTSDHFARLQHARSYSGISLQTTRECPST